MQKLAKMKIEKNTTRWASRPESHDRVFESIMAFIAAELETTRRIKSLRGCERHHIAQHAERRFYWRKARGKIIVHILASAISEALSR